MPPEYHQANQAFLNRSQPPPQGFYPGHGPVSSFPGEKKLFRPWEDEETKDVQAGLSNLKITWKLSPEHDLTQLQLNYL